MSLRPLPLVLLLAVPAGAFAQTSGADRLPLLWLWLLAAALLVAALGWLLFGGGVRSRRALPHERPPRP